MSSNDLFSLLQLSHADQSRIGPEATGNAAGSGSGGLSPSASGGLLSASLSSSHRHQLQQQHTPSPTTPPVGSGQTTPTATAIAEHLRRQLDEINLQNQQQRDLQHRSTSTSVRGGRAATDDEDGNRTTLTGLSFRRHSESRNEDQQDNNNKNELAPAGSGGLLSSISSNVPHLQQRRDNHDQDADGADSIAIGSHHDEVRSDYDPHDPEEAEFADKESLYASAMAAATSTTGELSTTTSGLGGGTGSGLPRFNVDAIIAGNNNNNSTPQSPFLGQGAATADSVFDPSRVDNDDVIHAALRHLNLQQQLPVAALGTADAAVTAEETHVDVHNQNSNSNSSNNFQRHHQQQHQHATFVIHDPQALVELVAESHHHLHHSGAGAGGDHASFHSGEESDPGQMSAVRLEALLMGGSTTTASDDNHNNHSDEDAMLVRVLVGSGGGGGGGAGGPSHHAGRQRSHGGGSSQSASGDDEQRLLEALSGTSDTDGNDISSSLQETHAEHIGRLIRSDFEVFRSALALHPEWGHLIVSASTQQQQ